MVIQYSTDHERNISKAKSVLKGQNGKWNDHSRVFICDVMKVQWERVLIFAGNAIIIQFGTHSKKLCNSTNEEEKNMFMSLYLRLRIAWCLDLAEFQFSLQQSSGVPSIRASLRTQNRVKSLPLHAFFLDVYGDGERLFRLKRKTKFPSREKQDYLFSVAQRLLVQSFYAGDASPNDIDEQGQTLLHVGLQPKCYVMKNANS